MKNHSWSVSRQKPGYDDFVWVSECLRCGARMVRARGGRVVERPSSPCPGMPQKSYNICGRCGDYIPADERWAGWPIFIGGVSTCRRCAS